MNLGYFVMVFASLGINENSFRLAPKISAMTAQPLADDIRDLESKSYMTSLIGDISKEKPFSCGYCSRKFNCKQAVTAHTTSIHKHVSCPEVIRI